jgi:polyisoprenoid-binding protein YceI
MRTHFFLGSALLLSLATPAAWAGVSPDTLRVQPESRIWVEGTSTVRSFRCEAKRFTASLDAAPGAPAAVLAGTKAVDAVSVSIPTQGLDCSNGTMNGHMMKAIKATENPEISFKLASYQLAKQGEEQMITMSGSLTLGGVTRPVSLTAQASAADGGLQVSGAAPLKLSDYGLKAPSLMMGTMKVGDQVSVHYQLILK